MNCAVYARVSTEKQAEKDLSIRAQLKEMQAYADQRQWTVTRVFEEPGASAQTTDRPVLQSLLALIRRKELDIEVLLVHKIDRFARNLYDYAVAKAFLKEHGIRLVSVVENVELSASGELIEHIMAAIAQFYSANLSDEVKKGMKEKVAQGGWPHRPPRGYTLVRSAAGSVIEMHPTDGPLMKRAFELYATGWYSVQALAARLAKEGLRGKGGGDLAHAHLKRLLGNTFYVGRVRWHDAEYRGTHPSLIPQALFDKVQEVGRLRYRNPGAKGSVIAGFPLRNLAVCAGCRGHMTGERHGKTRYYRCSRQTYRRDLCPGKACNVERAHGTLDDALRRLTLDRDLAKGIEIAATGILAERVSHLQRERERRLQDEAELTTTEVALTQAFTSGDVAPNDYGTRVAEIRAQRERLLTVKTSVPPSVGQLGESVSRAVRVARSLYDLCHQRNDAGQAAVLRQVFKTIVLDRCGVTGFTFNPPFDALLAPPIAGQDAKAVAEAVVQAAA